MVMNVENKAKNGDKSFAKLFDIIEVISGRSGGLSGREIARSTGIAGSTVFRMLKFLTDNGWLLNIDRRYILGPALIRLGNCAQNQNLLQHIAHPFLEKLADSTTETVHLAVLRGSKVFYIDKVEGTRSLRMSSLTGSFSPVYCTGVGKALLAFQEAKIQEEFFRNAVLERFTPNTITSVDELKKELAQIVENGCAIDNCEHEYGVFCVAAPIIDPMGSAIAGISISGSELYLKDRLAEMTGMVTAAAQSITAELFPGTPDRRYRP